MPAPYLTMEDIARTYAISPRTGREWARADRWRTTGTRPVRYHLADAQDSYEHRRTNRIRRHLTTRYAAVVDTT
ncbi:MAG TPA: hypothetical protein VGH57_16900 [Amycolatopsis sp.]